MRIVSVLSFIVASVFMGMGFYRMYVYENPESLVLDSKNVWVGGDAYNYIINGTHSTSFFVLCLTFVLIGLAIEVIMKIGKEEN